MPDSLLTILRLLLLTLIWLFFVRVLFLLAAKPKPVGALPQPVTTATPASAPAGKAQTGKANLRVVTTAVTGLEHLGLPGDLAKKLSTLTIHMPPLRDRGRLVEIQW